MNNFSSKKLESDTSGLSKILMSAIPTIEMISQNNADTLLASSRISQTLECWDLPNQIANLNAYLSESLGIQNTLFQSQSDILSTNIFSAFSISDEIYKTQSDILNSNLLNAFSVQDSLSQRLMSSLNGNLNISFNGLNNNIDICLTGLNNSLTTSFNGVNNNLIALFSGLNNNLSNNINLAKNDFSNSIIDLKSNISINLNGLNNKLNANFLDLRTIVDGQNDILNQIFNFLKNPYGDFYNKITSDKNTKLAEESNRLSKNGNQLAKISNTLAATAIGLQVIDMAVTAMTAVDPISKAAATAIAATGIAAAASAMVVSQTYATGGFPSMGQMFIAREAGPELVGTIGGRNAVVNNNQIVESVSAGVYKAVREAIGSGNRSDKIVMTLDKKVLGEATIGYINGKTRQTGLSPILV